jgi:CheY-like chemotaxis protein
MTKPIDRMQLGSLMHHLLDEAATILMVDDDPQSRELVRHQLKLANISFIEAGSGKEAVQWLSMNELPSLILLDLMMPDMDGFMFLQEIARHPEWQSIPVVVLSAKELTAQEREWLSEHARAVIAKSAGSSRDLSTEVRLALRAPRGSGHSA